MRVPQRLDYVLRALTYLAERPPGESVVTGDVAAELRLPKRFLEQQMTVLAKRGVVVCQRGAGGGCKLARSAEEISVAEIIRALQGDIMDIPRIEGSAVSEMWAAASSSLADALAGTSLRVLARRQRELDADRVPMYYI